jgi:hypothetical protein
VIGAPIASKPATCPVHGPYTSDLLQFGLAAATPENRWWTACPTCSLQHFRAKRGQGTPDLPEAHQPPS